MILATYEQYFNGSMINMSYERADQMCLYQKCVSSNMAIKTKRKEDHFLSDEMMIYPFTINNIFPAAVFIED